MSNLPRSAAACLHSPEPFHALFRRIAERTDISAGAKLLYGALVSQHRTQQRWTQAEIGETIGASRHQVWRWTCELVRAGLVAVIRVGLTLPNLYRLLGIAAESLDGRASGRPAPTRQDAGRPSTGTRTPLKEERRPRRTQSPAPTFHPFFGTSAIRSPGSP